LNRGTPIEDQINVIAKAPGLASEEVERQVTLPLERALNGTPEVISMRSESLFGLETYATTDPSGLVVSARVSVPPLLFDRNQARRDASGRARRSRERARRSAGSRDARGR
jgi:hypothetical protein